MHRMNDFKSINEMILSMRKVLKAGGLLVCRYSPLEKDYNRLYSSMPRFLFTLLYPIYFLLHRVIPKLPLLMHVYTFLSKGKGKIISKAEVYGRLSFCGFRLIDSIYINNDEVIILQLDKTISNEKNPSYGIITKLNRVGYNQELIQIYKFRTMHPYSEFIQKEIVENNSLSDSGKIKNDFRITNWGRIMRRLWIDELPQIINWLQGDISLVGVRALSQHYFSLYPRDLQELRTSLKPGLIPPYYADLPKNFDEIIHSEYQYLEKKFKNRFITDIEYLLKAMGNILLKGARSQ